MKTCTQYGLPAVTPPSQRPGPSSAYHRVSDQPKMTKRRKGLLDFIREFQDKHNGMPPSIREIGEAVGLASSSTVHCHLHALVKMGELEHDPRHPRSYRIANTRRRTVADLEAELLALESRLESRFQEGYQAGWRACSEQSCVETFTDTQGSPQVSEAAHA